jgi:hypothetical protein
MATTHPALLFLLVLACTGAASGFYLPGVAPADFRKVLALFPPLFFHTVSLISWSLLVITRWVSVLCVCVSWWMVAERLARREGEPAELRQDTAALLLLLPPLLQAGHHQQQRREPRPGPPWRPNLELTLLGNSCGTAAVCTIIFSIRLLRAAFAAKCVWIEFHLCSRCSSR